MRNPFQKAENPKRKRRTHTFVATVDGEVYPYSILKLHEILKSDMNGAAKSDKEKKEEMEKASDQRSEQGEATAAQKLASKPYNPDIFYWMWDNAIYVQSCVEQTASDIAGTGWALKVKDGKAENAEEEDRILALLEEPNDEYSIEDLWQRTLIDRNLIGYDGIEVVRNLENEVGEIKELWHMNASRIWRHKDKSSGLFAEKSATATNKLKYFVKFGKLDAQGKPLQVHKETGKVGDVEFKDRAHELIFDTRYYPKSSYYGAPPIAPASGEVVMGVGARDFNIAFFINYGIPSLLVMLSGEWEDDVEEDEEALVEIIKRQLKDIKGAENAHGSIVIQTPEGCQMTVEKLAIEEKEGSFRLIKADVAQDVLVAYRMPPYRIGLPVAGALAGDVADEMLRTYKTARVEPGQLRLEHMMNRLFKIGLGVENYELKLKDMVIWDEKAQAEINAIRLRTGQATHNQLLRDQGKQHLEFVGGNTYWVESTLLDIGEDETE